MKRLSGGKSRALLVSVLVLSFIFTAMGPFAGAETLKYKGITLSFLCNFAGVPGEEMQKVVAQFEAETGAKVEYSAPGASYEEIMKTKMATQDLPDLWTTHGWSVARYAPYLRELNDQPWFDQLSPAAKSIVTDPKNGKIYALPIDVDVAGIVYNKTILEECGINPDDLKTWVEFSAACEAIKGKGYIPVHIAGKDRWPAGHFFNRTAPSFYITNEASNFREEFKNGTFDWNNWATVCDFVSSYVEKGYFNVDSLTSDYSSAAKAVGEGKVAFACYGNFLITEAMKTNPDVKLGMLPVPSNDPMDPPSLIGGELSTLGVWKDTPHMEASLELLSYFAIPANMSAIASSEGVPAGFLGVESDMGAVADDMNKYMNTLRIFPYFDREYLPNGMWDDLCVTAAMLLAQEPNATEKVIKLMDESYQLKFQQ